jgi:hypothetical protein
LTNKIDKLRLSCAKLRSRLVYLTPYLEKSRFDWVFLNDGVPYLTTKTSKTNGFDTIDIDPVLHIVASTDSVSKDVPQNECKSDCPTNGPGETGEVGRGWKRLGDTW